MDQIILFSNHEIFFILISIERIEFIESNELIKIRLFKNNIIILKNCILSESLKIVFQ